MGISFALFGIKMGLWLFDDCYLDGAELDLSFLMGKWLPFYGDNDLVFGRMLRFLQFLF